MLMARYWGAMANLQVKNVPEPLHREIRAHARRRGRTLRDFVLDAVMREVEREEFRARLAKRAPVSESSCTTCAPSDSDDRHRCTRPVGRAPYPRCGGEDRGSGRTRPPASAPDHLAFVRRLIYDRVIMTEAAQRVRALVAQRGHVANRDVAAALAVSPATSHRLLRALVLAEVLERQGKGSAARYRFRHVRHRFRLAGLEEDRVWRRIAAEIARTCPLAPHVEQSLQYAVSEVVNNAIEHSRGRVVEVAVAVAAAGATTVTVRDDGVGVFRRLCEDFGFPSPQEAIVQLEKGKLTSDPSRHSGEGLFFTSKAVTQFRLESQGQAWIVDNVVGDTALGIGVARRGTQVVLTVIPGRTPRLEEVFRAFTDPEALRFTRTRTTVKLSSLGASLISRSEARRVVQRLAEFTHATLDFSGVDVVGQGFCDEVFRVFAHQHPEVTLEPVGMNGAVAFMVARARASSSA